jgi:hypothetical protein
MKLALLAFTLWSSYAVAQSSPVPVFEFRSSFWVNLHLFLYEEATNSPPAADTSSAWQAAVDYYRKEVISHDLLSREMEEIQGHLSGVNENQSVAGVEARLSDVLTKVAPEYRERWWKQHDQANHRWAETVKPLLAEHGAALRAQLMRIYQTDWPAQPIVTDLGPYAGFGGAYTTLYPTHITVASADPGNQGNTALEVLFHEASHGLIQKIEGELRSEAQARAKLFPRRDFWHALLFYTIGELTRRELKTYTPYALANGIYDRGWGDVLTALRKDWQPYLDGETDLTTAVRALVEDYGIDR